MLAWHFLMRDKKLRFPPYTKVEKGLKLIVEAPIVMCWRGLHACIRACDALMHAPGPIVCRVNLSGEIINDGNKSVATERTCLWLADATTKLLEFAAWCIKEAVNLPLSQESDHRILSALDLLIVVAEARANGQTETDCLQELKTKTQSLFSSYWDRTHDTYLVGMLQSIFFQNPVTYSKTSALAYGECTGHDFQLLRKRDNKLEELLLQLQN